MSTAGVQPSALRNGARQNGNASARTRRRSTSHLKDVPESLQLRDDLRGLCRQTAVHLDKSTPLGKEELEQIAREILRRQSLPEGYLGWTMVVLSSEFWRDQVAAVPPSRRLFLLPHCLKHAEGCPADYDQFGLDCKQCGACSIADFRTQAEDLGYKVLVAEGSPIVMKIIVSGYVDAIVGVACLNVLEKAIDKVLLAGIPCMAVPLLSSDCRNTSVDESWIHEMIQVRQEPAAATTSTFLHLLRTSRGMFEGEQLAHLAPRLRKTDGIESLNGHGLDGLDPVGATEAIAHDFLARGGKYARPFITLAAYDALTGGHCTTHDGAQRAEALPESVRRVALSIETFHKASLVHDDIEDDDAFRYGEPTLHRRFGTSTAINVGDYLIGLGYRLVSRESAALGHEAAAEILDLLADAHLRLSEGQGAELTWRDGGNRLLPPLDALRIYALKTAPAFEAALLCGIRCAGPLGELRDPLKQLAKYLGIAFQILNDLKDWQGDDDNKLAAGLDALGGRPTLLWALALESLDEPARQELLAAAADTELADDVRIASIERLYRQAGVFEKAHDLVDKYQQRALQVAEEVEPKGLRRLLGYLVETVLDRPAPSDPPLVGLGV